MKYLMRAQITSDLNEHHDLALAAFKKTGKFKTLLRDWQAKPMRNQTRADLKLILWKNASHDTKKVNFRNNRWSSACKNTDNLTNHWFIIQATWVIANNVDMMREMLQQAPPATPIVTKPLEEVKKMRNCKYTPSGRSNKRKMTNVENLKTTRMSALKSVLVSRLKPTAEDTKMWHK